MLSTYWNQILLQTKKKNVSKGLAGVLRREIDLIWKEIISGGLTEDGLKMVKFLVTTSECGLARQPQLTPQQLSQMLMMNETQVRRVIDELEGRKLINRMPVVGNTTAFVSPTAKLFLHFDTLFQDWDPAQDARRIAEDLVAGPHPEANLISARDLTNLYEWEPRRLNPALLFLATYGLVRTSSELNNKYAFTAISETLETRRFAQGLIDV